QDGAGPARSSRASGLRNRSPQFPLKWKTRFRPARRLRKLGSASATTRESPSLAGMGSKELARFAASGFAPGPPPTTHRRPGTNGRIGLSSSFYNKHLKTPVSESQGETGEARLITVTASAPADRPFTNVLFDFVTPSGEGTSLPQSFPSLLGVTTGHLFVSERRSDMEILMMTG